MPWTQFAPVHVRANTFGEHADLIVSPEHRILVRDPVAELLFGDTEVLVAAKYLVNGHSRAAARGRFRHLRAFDVRQAPGDFF